mmetsp:Transcript_17339/g.52539  ORF Transcript_17339/g.52539 Transcript_17339/m.52539 type:complete len:110 (-) Transcript_17339:179-508(-)
MALTACSGWAVLLRSRAVQCEAETASCGSRRGRRAEDGPRQGAAFHKVGRAESAEEGEELCVPVVMVESPRAKSCSSACFCHFQGVLPDGDPSLVRGRQPPGTRSKRDL